MTQQPKKNLAKKRIWFAISIVTMIAMWWILSETYFRRNGVIPPPPEVLRQMGVAARSGTLWRNVYNTMWKVLVAFCLSFVLGFVVAVLAAKREEIHHFVTPIITVIRAVPTIGVILILFMIFRRPETSAIVIAVMMVFPMIYEGLLTSIKETDVKLLQMAKVHKVPFRRQVTGIYVPQMLPYAFSSSTAGMGMTLKVVIAAEIIGIPVANTLGTAMYRARQSLYNFGLLFMWILVAIIISFLLEAGIKLLGKVCMPWKR
ncbi:MAG: ABC transporter permease subunit [Firmicutes bacterium]|nr:ABC transporter permease subunit [Bacillota bacterium]